MSLTSTSSSNRPNSDFHPCKENVKNKIPNLDYYYLKKKKSCKFNFSSSSSSIDVINKSKNDKKNKKELDEKCIGNIPLGINSVYNYPRPSKREKSRNSFDLKNVPYEMGLMKGIYALKYSTKSPFYVCGYGNGDVEMRDESTDKILAKTSVTLETFNPIVSCCFHPLLPHFLFVASSNGTIHLIKEQSFKCERFVRLSSKNEIHSIDVDPNGDFIFTACADGILRVHDLQTTKLVQKFEKHSSRIFCVKCHEPTDLLLSGGWDRNLFGWDRRVENPVKHIEGPYISGECIDYRSNTILTGSWTDEETIQLWDLNTTRCITTFRPSNKQKYFVGEYVYYCKFPRRDEEGETILVGRSYGLEIINWRKSRVLQRIEMDRIVQCLDDKGQNVLFGGLDPYIRVAKFRDL